VGSGSFFAISKEPKASKISFIFGVWGRAIFSIKEWKFCWLLERRRRRREPLGRAFCRACGAAS